jgi:hypothetical protein
MSDTDWRLNGQEEYLFGVVLIRRGYRRNASNPEWDHDHCEFCSAKFMAEDVPDVLHEGYSTEDEYRWVCNDCFCAFRERFQWVVESDSRQ